MNANEILNTIEKVMNTDHYNLMVKKSSSNYVAQFYPSTFYSFNENFINELTPVVDYATARKKEDGLLLIEVYRSYKDYINEKIWKRL